MRNPSFLSILFLAVSIMSFKVSAHEEKGQAFWAWFSKNEASLYTAPVEATKEREELFDNLSKQLEMVDDNLTFEFGPPEKGVRDFVISADGIKSSFSAVEHLVRQAPQSRRWKILPFVRIVHPSTRLRLRR